jgi:hypothetical protein
MGYNEGQMMAEGIIPTREVRWDLRDLRDQWILGAGGCGAAAGGCVRVLEEA